MQNNKLQWHVGLGPLVRIELADDMRLLLVEEEHLLGKKPMQMDLLVIKKKKDAKIQKNIGYIFRKHNIVEYKSPTDYLSVNDFYKVYGYACFYQADTDKVMEIDPERLLLVLLPVAIRGRCSVISWKRGELKQFCGNRASMIWLETRFPCR